MKRPDTHGRIRFSPTLVLRLAATWIVCAVSFEAAASTIRLESTWSSNPVRPGKPFALTVRAEWDGDADRYVIMSPQIELPDGLHKRSVSSMSQKEGATNVVTYRWEFLADKEEDIAPVPVKLSFLQKGEQEPRETETSTEPLIVEEARWMGLPPITLLVSLGAAMVLVVGVGWALLRRKMTPREPTSHEQRQDGSDLQALKEELNAHRVRGDTLSFLNTAGRICEISGSTEDPELGEITSLAEKARYGDLRLTSEQMERWHRKLKRMKTPS